MTIGAILREGFTPDSQQLKAIILDCFWRCLWVVLSVLAMLIFGSGVMAQMGSLVWEGPDLGGSNPIIVLAALRQFWATYGAFVLAASGLLMLAIIGLWLFLEALFRGGFKRFWIYLGTGAARTVFLLGTAIIFIVLSTREDARGTFFIGAVVMLGVWHFTGLFETVVRQDAVDLVATDFLKLSAVMGCLRLTEFTLAFLILGSAAAAVARSSDAALAIVWGGAVVVLWLLIQSYLAAVRYSAIDIMRRNVVRG